MEENCSSNRKEFLFSYSRLILGADQECRSNSGTPLRRDHCGAALQFLRI